MPPKPKLSKSKGKSNLNVSKGNRDAIVSNNPHNEQNINNNPAIQEQFEVELCWCIQQIQRALSSDKLSQQQVKEQTKLLNMLMSNSTSFVKKRQVMRVTFGDYRAKMAEENKKISKGMNLKISPHSPNKDSKFMKKSVFSCGSDPNFKFNFAVNNTENDLLNDLSNVDISKDTPSKSFHFTTSSNNFKFNFNVDGNES